MAGIGTVEAANRFLRQHYIPEMNQKFSKPAAERGHAFVPVRGQNLDRIFSVRHERVVGNDNTVRLRDRRWQLERKRFRGTLAGCRVTLCEHLDGRVSIVYGPHVVGRYTAQGQALTVAPKPRARRCGNDAPCKPWKTQNTEFPTVPTALGNPPRRDFHIPTAPTTAGPEARPWRANKKQNRTDHVL